MILPFINIRKVPREGFRFALGFQHFPRDLANVNDWKIIFDPSIIIINKVPLYALKSGIGMVENLGLRPRFSTLPSGPCEC